ncbi:MAG: outer membrane protein assembly factor BamD [Planctomycetota bacterium]
MRGFGIVAVVAGALSAGCATSSVERLSETPRIASVPGTGAYEWTEGSGWVQPERGSWGTLEEVRTNAFKAYQAGRYADALAGLLAIQDMPLAQRAKNRSQSSDINFYIAECYFQLGNYEDALEHYRMVYRRDFPAQNLLDQALQRVFTIGMAFLKGEAVCEVFGLIPYSCEDYGKEILADPENGLITEYPMVSFADTVLIEIAKYYFESGEYPEAVPLYDRVAADADSEWADFAEYQAAVATFRQVRGIDYDQRTLQEAERRFTSYLENTRGDHVNDAREMRNRIREMEGAKALKIAKFYLRESQTEACEIYLDRLLRHYPNSTAADEAREIQAQLKRVKAGS